MLDRQTPYIDSPLGRICHHVRGKHSLKLPRPSITKLLLFIFISLSCYSTGYAREIKRVIIDPGHGGKDKGSHRGKVYEKKLTLQLALKVEALLKKKHIPVTLTRRSDRFVSLKKRCEIANRYKKAIFISIHCNANHNPRYHGLETYYYGKDGCRLANHIHLRLISKLKFHNRHTRKNTKLAVLQHTRCPAILIECGYLSNPYERKRMQRKNFQNSCAKAIVAGILAYRSYR